MNDKSIEALRNGLEDSYWYSAEDAEAFEKMVRKARLYDKLQEDLERFNTTVWMSDRQFITHLFNFYEEGDRP